MKKNSIVLLLLIVPGLALAQTWTIVKATPYNNITAITIYQSDPDTMYALGSIPNAGLFRSVNGGSSWDTVNAQSPDGLIGDYAGALKVSPYDSQLLYAYVADPFFVGPFLADYNFDMSTDGGLKWKTILTGLTQVFNIDPMNPKMIYVGVRFGFIERSTDGGVTWDSLGEQPPAYLSGSTLISFAIASRNDSILYASYYSGIDKSTDRGNTWQSLDMGPAFESGGLVELDPRSSDTAYATVEATGGIYTILKSVDGGATWQNSDSGLAIGKSTITSMAVNPANPEQLFVGILGDSAGSGPLCYESTDAGTSWIPFSNGLPDSGSVNCIVVDTADGKVYSGFGGGNSSGIYVTSILTAVANLAGIPARFQLAQNYPNPFNPTTEIRFSVPGSELVTLQVYDILGQLVKTLVDKVEQPGSYEVQFNGSGLASGVYFYRLEAGSYSKTMKLMLLK